MSVDIKDLKVPAMKISELIDILEKAKTIYGDQFITTLGDTGFDTQFHARVTEVKVESLSDFFNDEDEKENRIRYQFHDAVIITGFDTCSLTEKNDSIEL